MAESGRNAAKALVYRVGLGPLYYNGWWVLRARRRNPWQPWNRANRAVFVHVPKNAGSSTYRTFGIPEPAETHCTAIGYRSANPALWRDCFRFAITRNPWDRFVSAFHYLKRKPASADDAAWAACMLGEFDEFAAFEAAMVRSRDLQARVMMWRHFTPQWFFLCDLRGRLLVDHLARFENLEQDLRAIGETIGIDARPARVNVVERAAYQEYYSPAGRDLVGRLYARDAALFGYDFTDGAGDRSDMVASRDASGGNT